MATVKSSKTLQTSPISLSSIIKWIREKLTQPEAEPEPYFTSKAYEQLKGRKEIFSVINRAKDRAYFP